MSIVKHELKQSRVSLAIWTLVISFMITVCVFLYPEMKGEMEEVSDVFASMGSFTQAFGMDKISFGTLLGYYAIECGNVLGLGGAFFAALCGVSVLSKEEKEHTAEFLMTHPVSRTRVITEKLIATFLQIFILNLVVCGFVVLSMIIIEDNVPWKEVMLLHAAYFLLQVEIAGICFGISAFLRRGSMGIGLGVAIMMYFLNLTSNITESAEFLKYITPFGYADGAQIVTEVALDGKLVVLGTIYCLVGIFIAYFKYTKKDIM